MMRRRSARRRDSLHLASQSESRGRVYDLAMYIHPTSGSVIEQRVFGFHLRLHATSHARDATTARFAKELCSSSHFEQVSTRSYHLKRPIRHRAKTRGEEPLRRVMETLPMTLPT